MSVTGVLEKSHTADDPAGFVDLKTDWIIEGLGHGHMDVWKTIDSSLLLVLNSYSSDLVRILFFR